MELQLKVKSKIESILGKTWMHNTKTYKISDYTLVGDKVIFSTDVKALPVPINSVEGFIKNLLPVAESESLPEKVSPNVIQMPGIDSSIMGELAGGLMTSFREIQGCKDPAFLKQAINRAGAKVAISKAITDIAKVSIAGRKLIKNND